MKDMAIDVTPCFSSVDIVWMKASSSSLVIISPVFAVRSGTSHLKSCETKG